MNNIDIKENINISDKKNYSLRGRINIFNKFGDLILEKDNLVVQRGRAFILEKLFESSNDSKLTVPYDNGERPIGRIPCLFTIGTGGAQVTGNSSVSSPSPFLPSYSDIGMTSQVPFISSGTGGNVYFKQEGTNYYAKKIDSVSWGYSESTNEVFKKLTLNINSNEARGYTINELGLLIGKPTYDNNGNMTNVTHIDLMTRVTFTGIPLTGADSFVIEYYLYA